MQRRRTKKDKDRLHKKNRVLHRFFSVSLDMLCVANTDGYFVDLNPVFETTLGYTLEELKATPFLEFIHPDDREATKEALAALGRQKILSDFVNRYRCKDGTYRWFEWRVAPSGSMIYGAARDITKRKIAEESARKRLEFERLLTEVSADMTKASLEAMDRGVESAFRKILAFFHGDRCCLLHVSSRHGSWRITHGAVAENLPPLPLKRDFSPALVPYGYKKVAEENKNWTFSSLDDLPPEADIDKGTLKRWGIRSMICMPIAVEGSAKWFLAITADRQGYAWPDESIPYLATVGEVIVNLLQRRQSRIELEDRLQFERLLADLSGRFVKATSEAIDLEIHEAMGTICAHLGFDLAALWQWSEEPSPTFVMTHLYRPMPGPAAPERMDAPSYFPWSLEQLAAGKVIAVSTDSVPGEAYRDRETWEHYGIKSSLVYPLSAGEKPFFGALSFNTIQEKRAWSEDLVKRLQLVAEVFANALARRNSERALRESEERLSLASSSAGVGIWILDLSTSRFWATAKALELFDLPSDHTLTFDYLMSLVHPEDRGLILRALNQASHGNEDVFVEYRIVLADKGVRWLSSWGRRQLGPSGEAEGLMGVTVDITQRKQAEEAAAEAQSMIVTLIESTDDMIWSVDAERFGLLTFNSALREYFMKGLGLTIYVGMRPEDMVTGPFTRAVADKWRQFYMRALREGPFTEEYVVATGTKTLLLSFNLLKRSGEIYGVSVFGKDITEQKRVEAEAFAARSELWRTDRLLRMGELTASLAHELNQPLTAILSNARAAQRFMQTGSLDREELKEILEDIVNDDKRAGDIIRTLRSMVRPDQGEQEAVDINSLLKETIALFNSEAIIRNVRIESEFADPLPSVEVNRIQLQQVVMNLLMNAIESMRDECDNRKIVVQTRPIGRNRVRVAVRDYGAGIDDHDLTRIFEPFFTTKHSGLGMGLSLARTVIEGQAGKIWAENNPDRGATFYFELPGLRE